METSKTDGREVIRNNAGEQEGIDKRSGATKHSGVDMRVIKTEKAIKDAVRKLMSEKDISQITPKDVADEALISKKTFFAHYGSVYDVLAEMEDDVVASVSELLDGFDVESDKTSVRMFFERLTALIDEDSAFYGRLMQSSTYDGLVAKVKDVLQTKLLDKLKTLAPDKDKLSYAVGFVAGGIMSAYKQWFNSGRSKSLGEISDVVGDIAYGSMESLRNIGA